MHTTTDLAAEARRLAYEAAALHRRLCDTTGTEATTGASAAFMALDGLADELTGQLASTTTRGTR